MRTNNVELERKERKKKYWWLTMARTKNNPHYLLVSIQCTTQIYKIVRLFFQSKVKVEIKIEMSTGVCTRVNEIYIGSILNDHDTFLFDCDGVLWCSPTVLPGAIELLNYLTASVCHPLLSDLLW